MPEDNRQAGELSPEEYARVASVAGLDIDARYVESISNVIASNRAAYSTVRGINVDGHEPAVTFQPVKRPDDRQSEDIAR